METNPPPGSWPTDPGSGPPPPVWPAPRPSTPVDDPWGTSPTQPIAPSPSYGAPVYGASVPGGSAHDDPWPTHPGSAPPLHPDPWAPAGTPLPPPVPPSSAPSSRPGGAGGGGNRWRGVVAAIFAAALIVGGVGYGVGRWSDEPASSTRTLGTPATTSPQPVVTEPAPLSGQEAEPAEAVAKALGPAVVQIETDEGLGSGFIYDKSGLIMTAAHVTDGASTVQVRMADGTQVDGRVVGQDPDTDVAVVKIPARANLPVAVLATGIKTEVGQTAIAIGSPFGLDQTVTEGIVSAVGRSTQTESGGAFPAIQTDAPINPGNSGGALADRTGRVIGINDSIATASDSETGQAGNEGVGFAIPIYIAKPVDDDLVAGRSPKAGFLGVDPADSTGNTLGAVIATVESGSPASKAGLEEGDTVTAVDGSKIESGLDLEAAIRAHKPGDTVTITVVRDGSTRQVTATLATAPHN